MAIYDINAEILFKSLSYDVETGVFTRVHCNSGNLRLLGRPAGYTDVHGYVRIRLSDGHIHKAHRLAWFWVYGENPLCEIDHIDGNKNNNRIGNLRKATDSENRQNIRKAHAKSSHGVLGATRRYNGRWQSKIIVNGISKHLGTFMTAEEAHVAYVTAKRELHPFCQI